MKKVISLVGGFMAVIFLVSMVHAHCQIPCGIYDDKMRTEQIAEDIVTVEKAMNQVESLSKEKSINYNQLVRWINNKEEHAARIMDTVSLYFMAQRIKPDQEHYTEMLTVLHKLMLSAMKSKQTLDLTHVESMRSSLKEFKKLYFKNDHDH